MSISSSENFKKNPCISCHTNCCKEYTIFVNAHDVYRISNQSRSAPESFLEIYGAKDYDLGIQVKEGLVDLALKQKNNACIFLEDSEDILRCTINDFKPGVCKSYPFQYEHGKLIQMADKMCPTDWDVLGFEKIMEPHIKKDEYEWNFYNSLILEWNAKHWLKKPLSAFLKFIINKVELSVNPTQNNNL